MIYPGQLGTISAHSILSSRALMEQSSILRCLQPCYVGFTSSDSNTGAEQYLARTVLGTVTTWESLVLLAWFFIFAA